MSAFVPAAALAAVVYACIPASLAAVAAVAVAATGLVLTSGPPVSRRAGAVVLCAVAIWIGAVSSFAVREASERAPGLPPSSVEHVEGRLVGHAWAGEDGWTAPVRVTALAGATLTVSADLPLLLSGSGDAPGAGSQVEARVTGLARGASGKWYAHAQTVSTKRLPFPAAIRARVYAAVSAAIAGSAGTAAPLLEALLLGSDDDLSVRTGELFRRAGISHVLALSGMHLAIIVTMIAMVTKPLFGRRVSLIVGGLAALLYTIVIGPRPSLVRATLMCEIGVILLLWQRPLRLVEILAAAFLLHLTAQPTAISSLSFGLSYLSLLGISVITPLIVREMRPWVPAALGAPLAAGVGAQVASGPLLLAVFGKVYPIGVVAGAVIGPVVAVFMMVGTALLLCTIVPVRGVMLAGQQILEALARVIEAAAWWFSGAGGVGSARAVAPAAALAVAAISGGLIAERRRITWTG